MNRTVSGRLLLKKGLQKVFSLTNKYALSKKMKQNLLKINLRNI